MSGDHDEPQPPEAPDPVEIWAKRTGRALGFVALFILALYLLFTYAP